MTKQENLNYKKINKSPLPKALEGYVLRNISLEVLNKEVIIRGGAGVIRGKNIRLTKYYKINKKRGANRLCFLSCGIELIKTVKDEKYIESYLDKNQRECFEIQGKTKCGQKFRVHIRKDKDVRKNNVEFHLISVFLVSKK